MDTKKVSKKQKGNASEREQANELLPYVSNNEVAVCGYCKGEGWIEEPMRIVSCPRCGGNKQTDC